MPTVLRKLRTYLRRWDVIKVSDKLGIGWINRLLSAPANKEIDRVNSNGSRLALCCIAAIYATPAYAYLDPGTGSLLIQGIIASIAAAGAVARLYWHKIVGIFHRRKEADKIQGAEEADDSAI